MRLRGSLPYIDVILAKTLRHVLSLSLSLSLLFVLRLIVDFLFNEKQYFADAFPAQMALYQWPK